MPDIEHQEKLELTTQEAALLHYFAGLSEQDRAMEWTEIKERLPPNSFAHDVASVLAGQEPAVAPDKKVREYASWILAKV